MTFRVSPLGGFSIQSSRTDLASASSSQTVSKLSNASTNLFLDKIRLFEVVGKLVLGLRVPAGKAGDVKHRTTALAMRSRLG